MRASPPTRSLPPPCSPRSAGPVAVGRWPLGAVGADADRRWREGDELRHLPADLADDLIATRLFQAWVPSAYGGDQLDVAAVLDAIEEASYHDGSLGLVRHDRRHHVAARRPTCRRDGRRRSTATRPRAPAGTPCRSVGRVPVDGGLRVSGRWQWGSGSDHCTCIGGGCLVVDDDGHRTPRADGLAAPFVFFAPDEVELLDTWDVMGMRATGSTDYEVHDVLVPEGRWAEPQLGAPVVDDPLYRFPFMAALALGVSAVSIGLARRAVRRARRPGRGQATGPELEDPRRAGRSCRPTWPGPRWPSARPEPSCASRSTTRGPRPSRVRSATTERRDLRLAATNATLTSTQAVDLMYDAAGGSAVHRGGPLERIFRDAHVATQHAMVSPRTLEVLGRVALGLPTDAGAF